MVITKHSLVELKTPAESPLIFPIFPNPKPYNCPQNCRTSTVAPQPFKRAAPEFGEPAISRFKFLLTSNLVPGWDPTKNMAPLSSLGFNILEPQNTSNNDPFFGLEIRVKVHSWSRAGGGAVTLARGLF